jgi:ligand-binding sensor domain-containing protein/serine phosphatase RsbU (regulator of sigma subunit)
MRIILSPFIVKVIRHVSLMILFFTVIIPGLQAQKYFFEKYGVEQGLSSSKVYSILQDKNDYIWLGTESGVSRFDGSKFENFSVVDGMAAGGVYSLFEDKTGRVWFGHLNGGVSCFDNNRFIKLRFDTLNINSDITSIKQLGEYLWLTTYTNGAIRISIPDRGDTIMTGIQYRGKKGLSDQVFNSCIDKKGALYCIADAGIKKFNPANDMFETFSPPGLTKYFNVIAMYEDKNGDYWYGTHNGGLYKKEKSSPDSTMKVYDIRDGLSKNFVSFITEDSKGNVWVGTWGGGITVFTGEKMKVYNKLNGNDALHIHYIIEDKEKNILIADQYQGFSIFKGDHFITYASEKFLPDQNVWAISEDESNKYWFGTNAGISVFNPSSSDREGISIYNEAKNTIGNSIRFIKPDHKGNIWIGTNGSGIFKYIIKTGKFVYDTYLNKNLYSDGIITALVTDLNDNLWIGTNDGVAFWNNEKSVGYRYSQGNGIAGNLITALFCDSKGVIWIGSERKSGLTKHIPGTEKFTIVDTREEYVPKTISETPDGRLWIGTSSGLIALKDDANVLLLNEENGLLSNNIKLLQPDGTAFLYIGTNLGLNRYDLTTGNISTFSKRNGFIGIETHLNASLKDSKGNLWFGTANGVTMLAQDRMPPVNTKPFTHINRMEVNYMPCEMTAGLRLNYREKSIIFYYYSVCLVDPDAVKYKVMLKGAEADWRPVTDQTMAIYSALSPGHYTFRVKASNSYGYWDENPVEYSFVIKPPFYLSAWFITLCLIVLIGTIFSYIKIRERNLIKEKKILEAKVVERTAEVVQKSMEIEEKNRDITASIRYAERIQRAMLPRENTFPETFVLFLPKDIVSGDFYWMYDNGDIQFMAAVDCTGHGVPGAFMSIIGHNSLNKAVGEYGLTRPSAILDQLNVEVMKALLQRHEKAINDGMDLALVAFNKEKFTLAYAGAYNPLYVVRKGEVTVYKGDRFPIGMDTADQKKKFTNVNVIVRPGDMIYMCSDGYADQFGSPDGKKFKSVNIKRILSEIWNLPICEQKLRLEKEILDWKGNLPQVDDIMFIGKRITEN